MSYGVQLILFAFLGGILGVLFTWGMILNLRLLEIRNELRRLNSQHATNPLPNETAPINIKHLFEK